MLRGDPESGLGIPLLVLKSYPEPDSGIPPGVLKKTVRNTMQTTQAIGNNMYRLNILPNNFWCVWDAMAKG